jgi:hypothetical protein
MQSCTDILKVNTSSKALKKFIGQLNTSFKDSHTQEKTIKIVLDSLIKIMDAEKHYEVFSFAGKVGIKSLPINALPEEGFCFCTSIYLECIPNTQMTIFRLSACNAGIELIVKDCQLVYSVSLL